MSFKTHPNTRRDHLHKISSEIINENQVIVSENLQIKNMVKNHNLAKSVSDASWYELTRQLKYKSKWNGRNYIKIDRFYASSQLCFSCGYKNTNVKDLKVRDWICIFCNTKHDRDINAAKKHIGRRIKESSIRKMIGQGLPELTPVEIVGYEVSEAGSP